MDTTTTKKYKLIESDDDLIDFGFDQQKNMEPNRTGRATGSTNSYDSRQSYQAKEANPKLQISLPRTFDPSEDEDVGERWTEYLEDLHTWLALTGVTCKETQLQVFRYTMGMDAKKIARNYPEEITGDQKRLEQELSKHYVKKKAVWAERVLFRQTTRRECETIDKLVQRLKSSSKKCQFRNYSEEEALVEQFILSCRIPELSRKVLQSSKESYSLNEIVDLATKIENTEEAKGIMESAYVKVNRVTKQTRQKVTGGQVSDQCRGCGRKRHNSKEECPAWGAECFNCGKKNHFSTACESTSMSNSKYNGQKGNTKLNQKMIKSVKVSDQEPIEMSDGEYEDFQRYRTMRQSTQIDRIYRLGSHIIKIASVKFDNVTIDMAVDSGCPPTVINEKDFAKWSTKPKLRRCYDSFTGYGSEEPIKTVGQFEVSATYKNCVVKEYTIVVVEGEQESLLGCQLAELLGVIRFDKDVRTVCINRVQSKLPTTRLSTEALKERFKDLFSDRVGCLKNTQVRFNIDPNVKPLKQGQRPIGFQLRDAVIEELEKQMSAGILERVTPEMGPTPWISNLVVVLKDGKKLTPGMEVSAKDIRLTCDSRDANKAILRARFPTKTVDDIFYEVNGSKIFSKVDIIKAFHQVEIAEDLRYLTVVTTPIGLLRYKRLHMGISCASELFTELVRVLLGGIPGQINMTDDILIHGANEDKHQDSLIQVLKRLDESGLTAHLGKSEFYKSKIIYFGLSISGNGIAPLEDRCKALRDASAPENHKDLHSFLCTVQWSARFIKDLNIHAAPLWKLVNSNVPWSWNDREQQAFDKVKESLTSRAMAYFNKAWNTELEVDASPEGLGAVLMQFNPNDSHERHIVAFASRLLSTTERKYSQVEREALAIVWGCERFWLYVTGKRFRVITDNRACQLIFANTVAKPPPRIERMALRMSQFDCEFVHRPGNTLMADYYSRHPIGKPQVSAFLEELSRESHINLVVQSNSMISRKAIASETLQDNELQLLARNLNTTNWPKELEQFKRAKDEISRAADGVMLKGQLIIVPKTLRYSILKAAHQGHQGMVKTKAFIRSRVWYPGINEQVEELIKGCRACQATDKQQTFEPLKPTEFPEGPWENVDGDFFGPLPDGSYWFVNIDEYSRYPCLNKVSSVSFQAVKKALESVFSFFGFPVVYKTDNGSPFQSQDFADYAKENSFEHRRVTPGWPRANGEVEAFMKNLGKVLKTSRIEKRDNWQAAQEFVRSYQETPHSTTKVPPALLLLSYRRNIPGMPGIRLSFKEMVNLHFKARENDKTAKSKQTEEYNKRMKAEDSQMVVGDTVLAWRKPTNKSMTSWDPEEYVVVKISGSAVTAERSGENAHSMTRNSAMFKRVPPSLSSISNVPAQSPTISNIPLDPRLTDMSIVQSPGSTAIEEHASPSAKQATGQVRKHVQWADKGNTQVALTPSPDVTSTPKGCTIEHTMPIENSCPVGISTPPPQAARPISEQRVSPTVEQSPVGGSSVIQQPVPISDVHHPEGAWFCPPNTSTPRDQTTPTTPPRYPDLHNGQSEPTHTPTLPHPEWPITPTWPEWPIPKTTGKTGRPKGTTKEQAARKHKENMEEYQRQRDSNPNIRRSSRRNN